jgi:hypothetical protein
MSKELEAIIRKELEKITYTHYEPKRTEDINNAMNIIKQSLTPPTAEQLCEELGEWLKEELPTLWNYKVYHDNGGFHYYNNEDYEIYLVDYDEIFERIFFPRYLPPRLIKRIAQFYESEVK